MTRTTNETNITSKVDLSSDRVIDIKTGIGFYDHMLEQLAKHSGISVQIECDGDLHIDEHHTVEDVAITLGDALRRALSTKAGIERYGFTLPMDDALCTVSMDLSGRPYFKFEGEFKREIIGGLPTELIIHFFYTLSQNLKANIHISVNGDDDHHKAESCFKCFGRAFSQAINKSSKSGVPSTKGITLIVKKKVAIIDSIGSNMASLIFALKRIDLNVEVTNEISSIKEASHIILPGVGAAKNAMMRLRQKELINEISNFSQPTLVFV